MNLSRISVSRSKSDLVAQVSKAYYTVLVSRQRINLLEANITRLKKSLSDTKAFNQQGLTEGIDVERLEVQYNNLTTEKEKTLQLIGMAENVLKFQMGYTVTDPIALTDSLNVNTESFQPMSTGKTDFSQRPDYQLAKAQQSLLDLDVKRWKWGYLPTLSAYGSYQYNTQRNTFGFGNDENDPTHPKRAATRAYGREGEARERAPPPPLFTLRLLPVQHPAQYLRFWQRQKRSY